MKKTFIAVLVGAIIMFAYQALSWMALPVHKNAFKYTSNQDAILQTLSGSSLEDGMYMLPSAPPDASKSEHMNMAKANEGKPWAILSYHPVQDMGMGKQMIIGFLLDFIAVWLFVWIVTRLTVITFGRICMIALAIGIIVTCNARLMDWNWWETQMHFICGEIIDAIVMWALTGLWVGWYFTRKAKTAM